MKSQSKVAHAILLVLVVLAPIANAQTFTKLADFDGTNGGAWPFYMTLVQGRDGNYYGTTSAGGIGGTVFKINASGELTTLNPFCAALGCGDSPFAGLVLGSDGYFYGTTYWGGLNNYESGGAGILFKIDAAGNLTKLHDFCNPPICFDGLHPVGALTQGADGSFYGTTAWGSTTNSGTVFKFNAASSKGTTILGFDLKDGGEPFGKLIEGTDGDFYGTTSFAGLYGPGTVFKISAKGLLTTLYNFCAQTNCSDGARPYSGLVLATDGNFYGTTFGDGDPACQPPTNCGSVFKITPQGTLTTLHAFCASANCSDGASPTGGLVQGTDGNLYGTTTWGGTYQYYGMVFRITPQGTFTVLHSFDGADGNGPYGGLLQGTNGVMYGTTFQGGAYNGGTVFAVDVGLTPFVGFVRAAGRTRATAQILGQGFTGSTRVSFAGIPASFTVISDTYLEATIPAAASTGYVTVTTPTGVLTSNVPFTVIR